MTGLPWSGKCEEIDSKSYICLIGFLHLVCLLLRFLLMADFDAYLKCQERVSEAYQVL